MPFCFKLLQPDSALVQATIKPQMAQGLFGVALAGAPRQSPLHHSKFDVRYSIFEFLAAPSHQSDLSNSSNLSDLSDPSLHHPKLPFHPLVGPQLYVAGFLFRRSPAGNRSPL